MSDAYASDAGHWYTREGEPCYEIVGKNGNLRNTTLRDARKLSLVPSVTEVMKIMAKPGLEVWKIQQAIYAALTLPQKDDESSDDFVKRVQIDAREHARTAAETGTRIHGSIERAFQGLDYYPEDKVHVEAVRETLHKEFPDQEWFPEHSFSHTIGYGGKIDLHSANVVIDYKTKEFSEADTNKAFSFIEHKIQLSAYRHGLCLPRAEIANVFISVNNPGLIKVERHATDHFPDFAAVLHLWKILKKYYCAFDNPA